MSKTRIIATLGPSSSGRSVLFRMVQAGMDIGRLNFSHGTHSEHLARIALIRDINKRGRRCIEILQDLEGFRIRVGKFGGTGEKLLKKKDEVWFVRGSDPGDNKVVPLDYDGDFTGVGAGQKVFIDDGNIVLKVKSSSRKNIKMEVVEGGVLKERKGVNMPGVRIPFSALTEKDATDMEFGIEHKVDYIAQSFVRWPKDMMAIREAVAPRHPCCRFIAKIENKEAIKNIDGIIDASDGIMIARGDMGIAVPIYEIAFIQKTIIKKCNRKKKFVITATEMLEHMTEHMRPTRAEVTDVANAILDGTDLVMLSAESASGKHPVEAVRMMEEIIRFTEKHKNG